MQNLQGEAVNLHTLGEISYYQNDLEAAEQLYLDGLERFQRIGARRFIAASLASLGDVYSARGEVSRARDHQLQSLRIETDLRNRLGMANSLRSLGLLEHKSGRSVNAGVLMAAADAECARLGTVPLPNRQDCYELQVAAVREALGESRFTEEWRHGAEMTLEDAMAYSGIL